MLRCPRLLVIVARQQAAASVSSESLLSLVLSPSACGRMPSIPITLLCFKNGLFPSFSTRKHREMPSIVAVYLKRLIRILPTIAFALELLHVSMVTIRLPTVLSHDGGRFFLM